MKRAIAAALLFATPALAQQPDAAQAFAKEWGTVQASDVLTASSHEHVAELAQKLVADYQRLQHELADAKKKAADMDAYLKACADAKGCTAPVNEQ